MNSSDLYLGILGITLVIIILVAGVIISVIISNKQRAEQKAKISMLELTYEKELRDAETEVKEQLMGYFSREIHDNVGHTLTYMRLLIENKKIDDPSLIEVFKPIETFLVQASDQLRMLSRSMNTDYIQQLDLKEAITLEVERLRNISQNKVELIIGDSSDELILDKNQQLMAFRIFQEILNNSIKHSAANKISIRYKMKNYILQVEDNGKGFSIDDVQYSNRSSGLNNMRKRAELAKMTLDIVAQPEKGSILTLNFNNIES